MKKKFLLLAVLCILSILIISLIFFSNKTVSEIEYSQDRVITSNSPLKNSNNFVFKNELSLMKIYNDKLYFVSWTENNYNKIFYSHVDSISNIHEIELEIDKEKIIIGEFFIHDSVIEVFNKKNYTLLEFNLKGVKKSEIKLPFDISRISKIDSTEYIISGWEKNNKRFPIYYKGYNAKQNITVDISLDDPYFKEYSYMSGLILDGMYFTNEEYSLSLPYSVSRAFVFNEKIKYQKSLDLIYKKIDFKFRNASNGDVYASPQNINPNISGFLNSSNIFYLLAHDGKKNYFIDLYNIEENEYLKSYSLANTKEPRFIAMFENQLFILYRKELEIFNINN